MPYRRLPNTDSARIRAMKSALEMSRKTNRKDLAFSPVVLQRLTTFLPHFEMAIANQRRAFTEQTRSSKKYTGLLRKARLYVSHFIQVLNFTIIRGEFKPAVREFYGIDPKDKTVPSLVHDIDVVTWGERVLKGEQQRIMKGGNPIYSPSVALVRVNYENFKQAYDFQKILKNNSTRFTKKVSELREEADNIILTIWNQVEEKWIDLNDDQRRDQCSQYGLVYVYRKGEKERLRILEEARRSTLEPPFTASEKEDQQIGGNNQREEAQIQGTSR